MASAIVTVDSRDNYYDDYYYERLRGYPWMYCRSDGDARRWIEAFVNGAAEFSDGSNIGPMGPVVIVLLEDERRVPPAMASVRFEGLVRTGTGRWMVRPVPGFSDRSDINRPERVYISRPLESLDRMLIDDVAEMRRADDQVDAENYAWSRVNVQMRPPPEPRAPTDEDIVEHIKKHGWGLLQACHSPMRSFFGQRIQQFAQNLRAFIEAIPAPYEGISAFVYTAARLERLTLPVELDRHNLVSDDNDWHRERYALIEL